MIGVDDRGARTRTLDENGLVCDERRSEIQIATLLAIAAMLPVSQVQAKSPAIELPQ